MEISELITIIREDHLDDVFSGWESASDAERDDQFLWSDKALLRYINEAQKQACNRTNFLYDDETFTITLVAGAPSYTIDPRIVVIENIEFDQAKSVTHMSKDDFRRTYPQWRTFSGIESQNPVYVMRGRKLRIYPIPDVSDAGKLLSFEAYRTPLENITSTSDELEIPEEFHRDLIWWVLYEAYSKPDADGYDKDRGLQYLAQFNQTFGEYVPSEVRLNQLQEAKVLRPRPVNYLNNANSRYDPDWPD